MFVISFLVALLNAFLAIAFLRIKSRAIFLTGIFLIFCTHIVLVFLILGTVGNLGSPGWFLAVQVFLLIFVFAAWLYKNRPDMIAFKDKLYFSSHDLLAFIRKNPILAIFSVIVSITYGVNAYLIYVIPPNNNDSHYVHMAKIGHWMLNGSLDYYLTHYSFQHYYPFNAQSIIYWTTLFTESDHFAGFVQFGGALFGALLVYILARSIHLRDNQSFFASMVFLSIPQVFFGSTTTQVDLIVAALTLGAFVLFFHGMINLDKGTIILSAIAYSLAIGTKQTAIFTLPAFLAGIFWYWFKGTSYRKSIQSWLVAIIISGILLASSSYIRNFVWFNNFMGPNEQVEYLSLEDTNLGKAFLLNTSRLLYQSLDSTALPPILEGYIFRGKAHLAQSIFEAIRFPLDTDEGIYPDRQIKFDYMRRPALQEDSSWFGLISAITLPILLILSFFRGIHSKNVPLIIIPLTTITFHLFEFFIRPGWDFYLSRNYLIPVAIAAPLFGWLYRDTKRHHLLSAIIMILSGYMLINMVMNNESKPLIGRDAIWNLTRSEKITLQARMLRTPLDFVERKVPDGSTIGLSPNTMEYPYFGERFTRNITAVKPIENIENREWLIANEIDYLLVNYKSIPDELVIPFEPVLSDNEWGLYKVE